MGASRYDPCIPLSVMKHALHVITLIMLGAACAAPELVESDHASGPAKTSGPAGSPSLQGGQTTPGFTVTKLSLYQSLEVPLMANGSEVTGGKIPIVAGRPALVRIFVEPIDSARRTLHAALRVDGQSFEGEADVQSTSTDGDLTSTVNIELPKGVIQTGSAFSAEISAATTDAVVHYPMTGTAPLHAVSTGGRGQAIANTMVAPSVRTDSPHRQKRTTYALRRSSFTASTRRAERGTA
jgi:hypothetical protein